MRHRTERHQAATERTLKDIRRKTRKRYSSEEKIHIVLAGLRGEDSIAELCRQEGIAQGLYYIWRSSSRLGRSVWLVIRRVRLEQIQFSPDHIRRRRSSFRIRLR